MGVKLREKGDCFKANATWVIDNFLHVGAGNLHNDVFLCHGKVVGSPKSEVAGEIFVHAWIEMGDIIMDFSNGNSIAVRKERLYDAGRILKKTVVRYNPKEVAVTMLKHKHYGPWAEELSE